MGGREKETCLILFLGVNYQTTSAGRARRRFSDNLDIEQHSFNLSGGFRSPLTFAAFDESICCGKTFARPHWFGRKFVDIVHKVINCDSMADDVIKSEYLIFSGIARFNKNSTGFIPDELLRAFS